MREYIFRGKDVNTGEWVEGFLYCFYNFTRTVAQILTDRTNGIPDAVEVDPETVGQYTGLTDKNGKKIFEGDIVKDFHGERWAVRFGEYTDCSDGMQVGFHYYRPRKFRNGSVGEEIFCMLCSVYYPGTFDVIGNIHDHPDLLKEGGE